MAKKSGLGEDPLDSVFKGGRIVKPQRSKTAKQKSSTTAVQQNSIPTIRLSIPLRPDQETFLNGLTSRIRDGRAGLKGEQKERITKGAVVRALLDILKDAKLDVANIADEAALLRRLRKTLRRR